MESFHDEDFSSSVAWETGAPTPHDPPPSSNPPSSSAQPQAYSAYPHDASPGPGGPDLGRAGFGGAGADADAGTGAASAGPGGAAQGAGQAVHDVQVRDGKVELEGTSDTFVSYLVCAKVRLLFPSASCIRNLQSNS